MSNLSLDITKTQKYMGKYVKKPVLTEKLLSKPPFRFLHDIIKVIIKEHGFLKDLFSEHELNYENIKDKDAKIAFLNKLIDAVSRYYCFVVKRLLYFLFFRICFENRIKSKTQ